MHSSSACLQVPCTLTCTVRTICRRLPSNTPLGVEGMWRRHSRAVPEKMGVSIDRGVLRSLMGTVLCCWEVKGVRTWQDTQPHSTST